MIKKLFCSILQSIKPEFRQVPCIILYHFSALLFITLYLIIIPQGRLRPGRMLLVDTMMGSVVEDHELKHEMVTLRPCSQLLKKGVKTLKDIHQAFQASRNISAGELPLIQHTSQNELIQRDRRLPMFGYSLEDLNLLILPMVKNK